MTTWTEIFPDVDGSPGPRRAPRVRTTPAASSAGFEHDAEEIARQFDRFRDDGQASGSLEGDAAVAFARFVDEVGGELDEVPRIAGRAADIFDDHHSELDRLIEWAQEGADSALARARTAWDARKELDAAGRTAGLAGESAARATSATPRTPPPPIRPPTAPPPTARRPAGGRAEPARRAARRHRPAGRHPRRHPRRVERHPRRREGTEPAHRRRARRHRPRRPREPGLLGPRRQRRRGDGRLRRHRRRHHDGAARRDARRPARRRLGAAAVGAQGGARRRARRARRRRPVHPLLRSAGHRHLPPLGARPDRQRRPLRHAMAEPGDRGDGRSRRRPLERRRCRSSLLAARCQGSRCAPGASEPAPPRGSPTATSSRRQGHLPPGDLARQPRPPGSRSRPAALPARHAHREPAQRLQGRQVRPTTATAGCTATRRRWPASAPATTSTPSTRATPARRRWRSRTPPTATASPPRGAHRRGRSSSCSSGPPEMVAASASTRSASACRANGSTCPSS